MQWMPHGMCYLWTPSLIWAHALADAGIALAYFTIPLLLRSVANQSPARVNPLAVIPWFIAFIALCGVTHLFDIIVIWYPLYATQALVKWVTFAVSLGAARELYLVLLQIVRALSAEKHADLIHEIRRALEAVKHAAV